MKNGLDNFVHWIEWVCERESYSAIWIVVFDGVLSFGAICLMDLMKVIGIEMIWLGEFYKVQADRLYNGTDKSVN